MRHHPLQPGVPLAAANDDQPVELGLHPIPESAVHDLPAVVVRDNNPVMHDVAGIDRGLQDLRDRLARPGAAAWPRSPAGEVGGDPVQAVAVRESLKDGSDEGRALGVDLRFAGVPLVAGAVGAGDGDAMRADVAGRRAAGREIAVAGAAGEGVAEMDLHFSDALA